MYQKPLMHDTFEFAVKLFFNDSYFYIITMAKYVIDHLVQAAKTTAIMVFPVGPTFIPTPYLVKAALDASK